VVLVLLLLLLLCCGLRKNTRRRRRCLRSLAQLEKFGGAPRRPLFAR
jgi:Flp pilus assembly protein TadB